MLTSAKNLNLTLPGNTQSSTTSQIYARVDKMMAKQNASIAQLNSSLNQDKTKLSSLGQIQSLLTQFQSLAKGISASGLSASASSSDTKTLTAQITGSVTPGQYHVQVRQLASAQTLATQSIKSSSSPIGSGTATQISVVSGNPKTTRTVNIDASNNSLQGIAAALKSAGIDASVQAAPSGKGYSLTLTSGVGANQEMQISVKGDATLKALMSFNPANTRNGMTQTSAAQDAVLSVNGKTTTSSSNKVSDVIPGTLLEIKQTGSSDMTISQGSDQDRSQIKQRVSSFVTAYNQLINAIGSQQSNTPAAATATQVKAQLDKIIKSLPQGSEALNQIGIQISSNGSMTLDTAKLEQALNASGDKVSQIFSHQGQGIADLLSSGISDLTGSRGTLQKDISSTSKEIDSLTVKRDTLSSAATKQSNALVNLYSQQAGGSDGTGKGLSLFDYFV